ASWRGCSVEHVRIPADTPYEFSHAGELHYLALHDIRLRDGEMTVDTQGRSQTPDLRETITFVPKGCGLSGWAHPEAGRNTYVALHFDPALLKDELAGRFVEATPGPLIYGRDARLQSTLLKLRSALLRDSGDRLYIEGLCLVAGVEVLGLAIRPSSGKLSDRQVGQVRDYIDAHLADPIALDDLAGVAGLSRFHFSRAFKITTGISPGQFVSAKRVETASRLLATTDLAIDAVAAQVGLNAQQLRRAFLLRAGGSPRAFRRDARR
ncbi:MAG: AraC family transcriptional regulator, partial [Hyphomonadaceae bacterium]|nr:AraC family transcriptional regulator [Hyphomonadaceae bacterium]